MEVLKWLRAQWFAWDDKTCAGAAEGGHIDVLEWLISRDGPMDGPALCAGAARGGHLSVLEWASRRGYLWDKRACANAAGRGHLHVLRWLRERDCSWDKSTCYNAAREGHLDVLEWRSNTDANGTTGSALTRPRMATYTSCGR